VTIKMKQKVVCPHCNREKHTIESHVVDGVETVKKVGKRKWHPLLNKESEDIWHRNISVGLGIECKCGRTFFAFDILSDNSISVSPELSEKIWSPAYCVQCQSAFVSQDIVCPTCGKKC